ncbi:type VI secretion system protein TssA [Pantoea agglomerans]|uniref:type VI secretion system protein TssA n=1 Tax=Enterobacter agglomerans TaxID=549 RepID=UPI002413CBF2|nr:type VI secretion system protein TssA [Pantoea agglomerans]
MKIDLDELLVPFPGKWPAGKCVEYEPVYEEIRQARESDPDYLPQDEWRAPLRKADWPKVIRLSTLILRETSKDLQVACWLVEGFSQQYGINGIRESLAFLHRFIIRYWDCGWPDKNDDDGQLVSHAIVSRLDRHLAALVIQLPLLGQPESTLEYWQKVLAYEYQTTMAPDGCDNGDFSAEKFQQWASRQPAENLARLNNDLSQLSVCLADFESAYQTLNPQTGVPALGQTAQGINDLKTFSRRLTELVTPVSEDVMSLNVLAREDEQPVSQTSALAAGGNSQKMSRDLAITQMLTIAHFFRQTEPSSPVPFLMERAARWAAMTLTEWLEEMLSDNNSLHDINNVLTGPGQE